VLWLKRRGSRPDIVPEDETAPLERPAPRRAAVGP